MRRTCESGQATVEAAFLLPVLFVGLLLLMQPGILLYDRLVMQAAASEAVSYTHLSGSSKTRPLPRPGLSRWDLRDLALCRAPDSVSS